jgi:hypothetical protein
LILTVNDNFHAILKFLENRPCLLLEVPSGRQENSAEKQIFSTVRVLPKLASQPSGARLAAAMPTRRNYGKARYFVDPQAAGYTT